MAKNYVQISTSYLAGSGTVLGAISITVNSFTDIYGNVLTMADFGDKGYGTVEPDTSNEESFILTSITVNANSTVTLGGVLSTLAKAPYTETVGLVRAHVGGSKVVITDTVAFWATFANKYNDESISGQWSKTISPVSGNDIPNKNYVDSIAVSGAPDASLTTKGITRLSTSPNGPSTALTSISNASPAVLTLVAHGLTLNDSIQLTTSGTLPTGVSLAATYYIISTGLTANAFQVSATLGGVAINTSSAGGGTHSFTKTTPISVGDLDPRVPTQGENDAMVGTSGNVSTTNKYITENDTSNSVSQTSTTISFASAGKTISDSANGFVTSGFRAGASIAVTGAASNNGTYTIVSVAAGAIVVVESLVNEGAGASMTLTTVTLNKVARFNSESSIPLPYLPVFGDGSDGTVTVTTTITLTRDMYYNNLTISGSGKINSAGYKIFVRNTFTNTGLGIFNIGSDGIAGANNGGSPAPGGAAGTLAGGFYGDYGAYAPSGGGGGGIIYLVAKTIVNEGILDAHGGNGGNGTSVSFAGTIAGSAGNASGYAINPSQGGGGGGFSTGTYYANAAPTAASVSTKNLVQMLSFYDFANAASLRGGGGGGRGSYNAGSCGGGGGGGGGNIIVMYKTMTTAGTPNYAPGTGGPPSGSAASGANGTSGGITRVQIS